MVCQMALTSDLKIRGTRAIKFALYRLVSILLIVSFIYEDNAGSVQPLYALYVLFQGTQPLHPQTAILTNPERIPIATKIHNMMLGLNIPLLGTNASNYLGLF